MQKSRRYRIFVLSCLLSLTIAYLSVWIRFMGDPEQRTGADFIAFYSAGRIAQQQGYWRVYEPVAQQNIEEEVVGFPLAQGQVLLYNHLPFLLPILRILVNEDYVGSFYRWVLLLIALYVSALAVLGLCLKQRETESQSRVLIGVTAFLFLPLFFSLMNGQDTAFLFLGVVLWMYGLSNGKDSVAGLGLSLTTVRPQISLMLAVPMLFRHRRVFVWSVIGAAILAAFSALLIGPTGVRDFINILGISAAGEWHGMKEEAMFNLIGLLTRTFPGLGRQSIRLIGWIVYVGTIIALSYFWRTTTNKIAVGVTVLIALFTSPHLHFHDLTLLLIPLYEFTEQKLLNISTAAVLPVAASLLLLASNVSPALQYTIPYLMMATIAFYPHYLKRKAALTSPHQA